MSLFGLKKKGKVGETSIPPMPELSSGSGLDLPPMPPSAQGDQNASVDVPVPATPDSSDSAELPNLPPLPLTDDAQVPSNPDSAVLKETELEFPDVAKFELPALPNLTLDLNATSAISKESNNSLDLDSDSLSLPDFPDDELNDTLDFNLDDAESDASIAPVDDTSIPELGSTLDDSMFKSLPGQTTASFQEGPLFVKVDTFKDILEVVNISKDELNDSLTLGENIIDIVSKETVNIDKFKTILFDVNKKLYRVEEMLFCR